MPESLPKRLWKPRPRVGDTVMITRGEYAGEIGELLELGSVFAIVYTTRGVRTHLQVDSRGLELISKRRWEGDD